VHVSVVDDLAEDGDLTLGSGTPFSYGYLVDHVIGEGIPGGCSGVAAGAQGGGKALLSSARGGKRRIIR
jgi:hypothetical protein